MKIARAKLTIVFGNATGEQNLDEDSRDEIDVTPRTALQQFFDQLGRELLEIALPFDERPEIIRYTLPVQVVESFAERPPPFPCVDGGEIRLAEGVFEQ